MKKVTITLMLLVLSSISGCITVKCYSDEEVSDQPCDSVSYKAEEESDN